LASIAGDAFGQLSIPLVDDAPPAAPGGLTLLTEQSRIFASWNANGEPDVVGYRIHYRQGRNGPPYDGVAAVEGTPSPVFVGGTNLLLRGLARGTNYFVAVNAVDTTGNESPLSAAIQVTTAEGPPRRPSGVAVRFGEDGDNVVTWALSEDDGYNDRDVVRYDVLRTLLPDGSFMKVGEAPSGIGIYSKPATSIAATQFIRYAVVAVDSNGLASPLEEGGPATMPFPRITVQPQPQRVVSGTNVNLSVQATGTWPLRYQWLFNGESIVTATNASLRLLKVTPQHSGGYSVVVGDAAGATLSTVAALHVEPEKVKPVVKITAPAAGARLADAVVIVHGTASDNVSVTNVEYRLENAFGLGEYTHANGTDTWSVTVSGLALGTNTFIARARDSSGNFSAEAARSYIYYPTSRLTVLINGSGTVSPNLNGQNLEVGKRYMLTAVPGPGYLFSNWTGTVTSSAPKLLFLMHSNAMLTANFVSNPFIPVKGNYASLFGPTDDAGLLDISQVRATNSGYFTVTLGSTGQFSGKLFLAGTNYSLSGRCDLNGLAHVRVPRSGKLPLEVDLEFDLQTAQVGGSITDGSWRSALAGNRTGLSVNRATRYTFVIPGADADEASTHPGGDGAGTVTVTTNGAVVLAGALGDGTRISQGTLLSRDGDWPIYASLYGGKGLLLRWGAISTNPSSDELSATNLVWFKPPGLKGKFYTNGFTESVQMLGARYARPGPGSHVLNWTNGVLLLDGGNLPATISNAVQCVSNKWVVLNNTHQVRLTNDLARGVFGGTFVHPVTRRATPFSGAYLQLGSPDLGWGGGWFAGTNETGFVELMPAPATP
jgi:hypothetical protein